MAKNGQGMLFFSLKDFRWWSIFFESDDGVMYDEGLKG